MTTLALMDFLEDQLQFNPGRRAISNTLERQTLSQPPVIDCWPMVVFACRLLGCDVEAKNWELLRVSSVTGPMPSVDNLTLGRDYIVMICKEARARDCQDPRIDNLIAQAELASNSA